MDRLVRELIDKQACTELVYRLARAIDRCDENLLRSLFHPDATDDHGMFRGSAKDFVDWVLPVLRSMKRTQHLIGNVLIVVDGDMARGESYFVAHHVLTTKNEPDRFSVAAGRYLDRFERRAGEWRFSHRQAVYDWSEQGPSSDTWDRSGSGWLFGARAPNDPSYAVHGDSD